MWLLLLRNWQYAVIAALVALLMFAYVHARYLNAKVATVEAEKAAVEQRLKNAEEQIANCNAKVDAQNAAIDKMKQDSDARVRRMSTEMERLRREGDVGRRQAEEIMRLKPQTGASLCDNANRIINEEIKGAKRGK
jgi:peptidoglycan hydrolase CwlO-like protein